MVFFSINLMNGKIRQMMASVIIAFGGSNPSNERCYALYRGNDATKPLFGERKQKLNYFSIYLVFIAEH
ncbi:hypothetical protein AL537_13615 [Vibrio diabolicus]|nr:hypothetical protein AL537_13615 [Vibrio diabolicus]